MAVKPIPDGFHTVTPYLIVDGVAKLIDFLTEGFGAEICERTDRPDGSVGHATVKIGDSMLMMGEPFSDDWKPMPTGLYLYTSDTDKAYQRALDAGAVSIQEPADQFYGDRNAGVKDPSGNIWWIATHIEDVEPEELERRAQEWAAKQSQG